MMISCSSYFPRISKLVFLVVVVVLLLMAIIMVGGPWYILLIVAVTVGAVGDLRFKEILMVSTVEKKNGRSFLDR